MILFLSDKNYRNYGRNVQSLKIIIELERKSCEFEYLLA